MRRMLPIALFLTLSSLPGLALSATPEAAYPWLADWKTPLPPHQSLLERFPTPRGMRRVKVEAGSYPAWLRHLPVRTDRMQVLSHRGQPVAAAAAAVVLLDVGRGNVQQCADSAIRLHAEYLWHAGRASKARYHFTSGHVSGWRGWVRGERFKVSGSRVDKVLGAGRRANHRTYRGWLQHLFLYAGTRSLAKDARPVGVGERLQAGDLFAAPGSPGHAVVLLDIAERPDGRRFALVGQGFMPAQDFHVVTERGPHVVDRVWFELPAGRGELLQTPGWQPFRRDQALRFTVGMPSRGSGR